MRELGVAIVGFGKIARDQYVPAALTPRLVVDAVLLGRRRIVEPLED
jgi:hypothetical protein